MAGIPEVCEQCGRANTAGSVIAVEGDIEELVLANNYGRCPYCGGRTRVVEGTFNVRTGVLSALSDVPDWSMQTLRQLECAAREAEELVAADPEAAIGRVTRVNRQIGALLRRVQDADESREMAGLKTTLRHLRNIAAGVLAYKATQAAGIGWDDFVKIVDAVLGDG